MSAPTLVELFAEEITDSPIPVRTTEAMLEACAAFVGDLADDEPVHCPNSLTSADCIEARAAIMQALAVFARRS